MKRSTKKGFTIVELVIVIAIIAILAAVLIPTFASLIQKANTSADIQACRQMNTYLAVNEVTADKTIVEVYEALKTGGMDAEDYKPLSSNTYYFWDAKLNRVLYTNDSYEVIYPEEYKNVKSTDADHQWYSLTTEIKGDSNYSKTESEGITTITVESGDQLYQAVKDLEKSKTAIKLAKKGEDGKPIEAFFENSINQNTVINITDDIDMMGASLSIGVVMSDVTLTINGNGHTIKGVSNLDSGVVNAALNDDNEQRNYYASLIKYVDENATVEFNNIKFDNIVTGRKDVGSSGILIGKTKGTKTNVTFDGVVITNSTLYGKNKLGAFIGAQYSGGTKVTVKGNTKLENVKIISTEGESGILFGSTSDGGVNTAGIFIDKALMSDLDNFIKNCSVVCESSKMYDATFSEGLNQTYDGKVVEKGNNNGYRPTTAYLGFAGAAENTVKFTMNGNEYTATNFNAINTYDQAVAAGWVWDFSGETPTKVTQ